MSNKTYQNINWKYHRRIAMWCWRRMEKISWTDRVRNEEVLQGLKEERNMLHAVKIRNASCIGHSLRRNCLLKHGIEGKKEGTRRRGWKRRQLLDDLEENWRYWNLRDEPIDRVLLGTPFGRGCGEDNRILSLGGTRWRSWFRHRATRRKVAGSTEFSINLIRPVAVLSWNRINL